MRGKFMLLVEDNPDDGQLALLAFQESGFTNSVVIVQDGQEALDFLFGTGLHKSRDLTDMPALVLLDLNLPNVNGLDVLARIRADARTKLLPVIILTSSKQEQDVTRSYSLGANSYLRKPVDFLEFVEAVGLLCRYWFELNQPPLGNATIRIQTDESGRNGKPQGETS